MGESSSDKTEEPTSHKLREARKKGQIVKSKEVTAAFLLIISYYVFKATAPKMWQGTKGYLEFCFRCIPNKMTAPEYGMVLQQGVMVMFTMLLPLFLAIVITALIAEAAQTGFNSSMEPLQPKLSKLNPLEGFKKIFFSLKGIVELIKSLVKIFFVFWIMYKVIMADLDSILGIIALPPLSAVKLAGDIVMKVVARVGLFYIFIAFLDYLYQRHEYMKEMKMSKQEVKEEYKKLEGDPQIKRRMRQMQREAAQSRSMGKVPNADAVVTNPTHVAIAIKYDASVMKAPQIIAKGLRKRAEQIRKIAEENFIPIIEKPELARGLYQMCEIGDDVPYDFYRAMAEVLAFVYEVKKKKKRG